MPIVEVIFPILLIAGIGYIAMRLEWMCDRDADAVARLAFNIIIPALLFVNTATMQLEQATPWRFLFMYYACAVFVFALATRLASWHFKLDRVRSSVFGIGACYSNIVIVGIPICSFALGEQSLLPLFLIVSVHNLALFTLGIVYAESGSLTPATLIADFLAIAKRILTTPITAALVSGGVLNLLDISLYVPLREGLDLLGQAAVPVALFVLGTSLFKYRLRGHLDQAATIVVLKILLFPALVYMLVFECFELDPLWAKTAVMVAAMPVAINAYIFSQKYQELQAAIASAIFLSTLAGILTLSVWITVLNTQ